MKIAATGHRPPKLNNEWDGDGPLSMELFKLFHQIFLERHCTQVISGMALGVDMLFAEVAIAMNIPVIAAIPFVGQETAWLPSSRERYHRILNHPLVTRHIVCEGGYAKWKMQVRNKWMVDNCDLLVAVFDGTAGGTKNCHDYAEGKKEIIKIDPTELIQKLSLPS
jgi:uncharacterized phage-like protein YoqJ